MDGAREVPHCLLGLPYPRNASSPQLWVVTDTDRMLVELPFLSGGWPLTVPVFSSASLPVGSAQQCPRSLHQPKCFAQRSGQTRTWWLLKAISTPGKLRQKNCQESQANLGYVVNWGSAWATE